MEEPAAIYLRPNELHGWQKNPRVNDHVVDELAASLKRFGFGNPILARRANREVIAGHTRLKAAQKLGLERVPVRLMDLSEHEAHLLALADNRLAEKADWNEQELLAILREYDQDEVKLAGWSADELKAMADDLLEDTPLPDEDDAAGGDAPDQSEKLSGLVTVLIECDDEAHQRTVLELCERQGLRARAMVL